MRAQLRRFAAVGVFATLVDIVLFVALRRQGWSLIPADLVALAVAAVVSYSLHRVITFRDDPFVRWMRSPTVFIVVVVLSGTVDLVMVAIFLRDEHAIRSLLVGKGVAVVLAAAVRTVAYRKLLLRVVRREQIEPARRPEPEGTYRFSIVVPAYNEGPRIATTIASLRTDLAAIDRDGGLEIIVVDDGSRDDTAAIARQAQADQVLVMNPNRGKGGAVRAGMLAANGRTVAFTDADLAYAPTQLLPLLAGVEEGWDVVVGNRRHAATKVLAPATFVRDVGSKVVNLITQTMLLGQYEDTQCGCKAFRSDVARALFGAGRLEGFSFDIELFHLIERNRLSLALVPVEVRNTSTSSVRAALDGWRLLRDVLRIRRWSREGVYATLFELPPRAEVGATGSAGQAIT
jgi:dolichyl-phosphate beta-glucosyltransferase